KLGITRCDVLKVDIEGHELKFLEGARKFISKFRPVTIIEANPYCLNIFNRISLPDFVDKVYKNFPYIFAFDEGRLLDLNESKSRSQFYFENTVKYKYQNIICGFDRVELLRIINSAFTDPMNRTTLQINNLVRKNDELTKQNLEILEKYEKIQSSNSHKIAIKVNKLLKR
ncbi:MAG: FkbM family methyltransferase, partial [Candidatus Saccharimonadales bacterium]